MLNVFKKIRKNYIKSGSTRKYLLYAIGEIFLVGIGILLALQVSKWNQQRVDRNYEKDYLERLIVDLKTDSNLLVFILNELEEKKEALHFVRMMIENNSIPLNDSTMMVLNASRTLGNDLPNARLNATYSEILSSGHLRLIRNVRLRNGISRYYARWEHGYFRITNRKSEYPSLILSIIDRDGFFSENPFHEGHSLPEVLEELNLQTEFRIQYVREVNYLSFTRDRITSLLGDVEKMMEAVSDEIVSLSR
jgi:hypothetical protein